MVNYATSFQEYLDNFDYNTGEPVYLVKSADYPTFIQQATEDAEYDSSTGSFPGNADKQMAFEKLQRDYQIDNIENNFIKLYLDNPQHTQLLSKVLNINLIRIYLTNIQEFTKFLYRRANYTDVYSFCNYLVSQNPDNILLAAIVISKLVRGFSDAQIMGSDYTLKESFAVAYAAKNVTFYQWLYEFMLDNGISLPASDLIDMATNWNGQKGNDFSRQDLL